MDKPTEYHWGRFWDPSRKVHTRELTLWFRSYIGDRVSSHQPSSPLDPVTFKRLIQEGLELIGTPEFQSNLEAWEYQQVVKAHDS